MTIFLAQGAAQKKSKLEFSKPQVVGVLFYADWCGSCKTLDPKLKQATAKFINEPVLFTTFDMTNLSTQYQSGQLAKALDLSELYHEVGVKTGFMILLDRESGKRVGEIKRNASTEEIVAMISKALSEAS